MRGSWGWWHVHEGHGEKYLGGTRMWESSRGHGRTVGACIQRAAVGDVSMGREEEARELVLQGGQGDVGVMLGR